MALPRAHCLLSTSTRGLCGSVRVSSADSLLTFIVSCLSILNQPVSGVVLLQAGIKGPWTCCEESPVDTQKEWLQLRFKF